MADPNYPETYPSGEQAQMANYGKPYEARPVEPPAVATLDGGVTPAQHYSIATSASRDELIRLHGILEEADKAVLRILERFQQA